MANRKTNAALAAIMTGLLAAPSFAQSTGKDEHHPATGTSQATPSAGSMPMQGMMGRGIMGQGMMGQGMMGQGMMGQGMMGPGHVEGRIAFLKTELKITDAQQKPWDAVADAMRANANRMTEMMGGMMAGGAAASLPERIAAREKLLSARLDALRKYQAAVDPLYAALSDNQKKTADELMPGMIGISMGGGMMGGGMMGRMRM